MPAPIVTAGLITGGASLAGSALDAFSRHQTNKVMRNLANTAHQREVKDLRAAGLNPILSAGGGGSPIPEQQPFKSGLGDAANSAVAAMQAKANVALTQETTRKAAIDASVSEQSWEMQLERQRAEIANLGATLNLSTSQKAILDKQMEELTEKIQALKLDNIHSALDVPRSKSEAEFYKSMGSTSKYFEAAKKLKDLVPGLPGLPRGRR